MVWSALETAAIFVGIAGACHFIEWYLVRRKVRHVLEQAARRGARVAQRRSKSS